MLSGVMYTNNLVCKTFKSKYSNKNVMMYKY